MELKKICTRLFLGLALFVLFEREVFKGMLWKSTSRNFRKDKNQLISNTVYSFIYVSASFFNSSSLFFTYMLLMDVEVSLIKFGFYAFYIAT